MRVSKVEGIMRSLGDVVAEPVRPDEFAAGDEEFDNIGMVRRGSLDSVDRISLASSTSSSGPVGSELGNRTLRSLKRGLGKLWRRHRGNASITEYDPCYKVAYLGNVLTGWAKGELLFLDFLAKVDVLRIPRVHSYIKEF